MNPGVQAAVFHSPGTILAFPIGAGRSPRSSGMTGQGEAAGRRALRELWYRWTAVVELFARRRRGRRQVGWQEYRALHEDLLRLCRSLAEAQADEAAARPYRHLESIVQPWLTPWALEQADRDVLYDLLPRCWRVGSELGGPT